ncbi:hypothetical protein CRG98_019923 [Punica granatum]|uniref:Uncharacterized protein n=1 Tax=Punica granatum TaxID=22663 RepID=A0A2I0JTU5_PUNGR|nr:hypothetical protein CRG98_019923 [Punica granatum]
MADDCEDLESLTNQLSSLVTSLQQQVKEDTGNPLFFLRTALAFCSNAERLLNSLHRALHFPVVDFNDILEYNIKLKGSSSRRWTINNTKDCPCVLDDSLKT